jgi:hypothetical protein
VTYDPGLDLRILDDAGTDPGILPLLGFLLEQLWEQQHGGRLRASTYQEIGGVKGALLHHAEQAFETYGTTTVSDVPVSSKPSFS